MNEKLKEQIDVLANAQRDFYYFVTNIFAKSFGNFVGGKYIKECCDYLQKYDRTMRVAFRSGFKCLPKDTRILLSDGTYKKIQDIQPGDIVLGFKNKKVVPTKVIRQEATGYKRILEIILDSGRTLKCSENHRVFTDKGWKRAKDLTNEDFLLVNKSKKVKGYEKLSDDEIKFLAYIIGDGNTCNTYRIGFTNQNKKIFQEFKDLAQHLGFRIVYEKDSEIRVSGLGIRDFLNKFGLLGRKSKEKQIPIEILNASPRQTSLFINRLWACDGRISKKKNNGSVFFSSASRNLIEDLCLLFDKLGILYHKRTRTIKLNGCDYKVFTISISKKTEQKKFLKEIGDIKGKEKDSDEVRKALRQGVRGTTYKIPFGIINFLTVEDLRRNVEAKYSASIKLLKKAFPSKKEKFESLISDDFTWEKIKTIKTDSNLQPTYDIETSTHNYFVNNILVHNSTSLYAKIMMDIMFVGIKRDLDIAYYSFNEQLAGWHIQQIKSLIDRNPFYSELRNLKPLAENVAAYTWDNKHVIRIRPKGIVSFSRGTKCDYIYLDDIYSDPASQIHPTVILKINEIFRRVILETLKPGGEIHVVGSTISRADIFFDPDIQKAFHTRFYPAITHDEDGKEVPTWPEFYTLEQLKAKRKVMGEKAFAAEMMCQPLASTDSFFKLEQLRKTVVNPSLRNIPLREGLNTQNLVIAGLDIGKKKHKSVLVVFEVKNGKAVMVHQKSMKGWRYYSAKPFDPLHPSQVEYCKEAIKNFGIDALYYDNTRGEFEGAKDSGLLTPQFIPIVFTPKMKMQMATNFEKVVLNKQLELFDDEEMLNSICSVTNDLQKIESAGNDHGDYFDAVGLALLGLKNSEVSSKENKEVSVGSPSFFAPDGWPSRELPKGW
ncbi:MAG: LAGLIDADG family homing endonuclease [Candidatus Hodarchaeales archaeon]